jgi:hypothetical protein
MAGFAASSACHSLVHTWSAGRLGGVTRARARVTFDQVGSSDVGDMCVKYGV